MLLGMASAYVTSPTPPSYHVKLFPSYLFFDVHSYTIHPCLLRLPLPLPVPTPFHAIPSRRNISPLLMFVHDVFVLLPSSTSLSPSPHLHPARPHSYLRYLLMLNTTLFISLCDTTYPPLLSTSLPHPLRRPPSPPRTILHMCIYYLLSCSCSALPLTTPVMIMTPPSLSNLMLFVVL